MYVEQEDIFYYITVMNEPWAQPTMPGEVREGILRGLYRFRSSEKKELKHKAQLFGSGAIMLEVLKAAEILEEKYKVAADVWSVTSYKELYKDGNACERWNILHPGAKQRESFVAAQLKGLKCAGGRFRLRESAAGIDLAVDASPADCARHRWLRPF